MAPAGRTAPSPREADPFPTAAGGDAVIVTFLEPPCLLVYGYFASAALIWGAWFAYRALVHRVLFRRPSGTRTQQQRRGRCPASPRGRQPASPRRPACAGGLEAPLLEPRSEKTPAAPLLKQCITDRQGRTVTFEGYSDSRLGSVASALVPVTSLAFLALFGVILADYYSGCEWSWPEQLCYVGTFPIFGSFDTNSCVFLVLWVSGTAWFGLLIWCRGGCLANLFRLCAPLHDAEHVHITAEEGREAIGTGHSHILAAWRRLLRAVRALLGVPGVPGGLFALSGGQSQTVPLRYSAQLGASFVRFRCVTYVLDPAPDRGFVQYDPSTSLRGGYDGFIRILEAGGLQPRACRATGVADVPTVEDMFRRTGPNAVPFEVDKWATAVTEEFATFFFLYQFAIYAVCLWYSYWHYTICALAVAAVSGFFNAKVRISNQREIQSMMEQPSRVQVLRGGQLCDLPAEEVVPGDIVKVVGDSWSVPCDLLLLRGAAVCDESMLTGESMPVQRLAPTEPLVPPQAGGRYPPKHVLVAGTTVLQVSGGDCWAATTHTGIYTQKGQLLLLILYPPALTFKYDEQLAVVFCLLIQYAILVTIIIMRVMYVRYASDQKLPLTATWASAVFACSCVLPTMLHVVLSVGQVMAAQRLKSGKYNVFSAAPKRIALGGKVRVACFDKTGTLTEGSLHFFGVHCVQPPPGCEWAPGPPAAGSASAGPFSGLLAAPGAPGQPAMEPMPRGADWPPEVVCCLASAHSLSPFAASELGVVGSAVEVSMFRASKWTLLSEAEVAAPGGRPKERLKILRRFDFSHSTMTMSAVVEHAPSGQRGVVCKGGYEEVVKRCRAATVPANLAAVAQAHAYTGMYVLGIAARALVGEKGEEEASECFATREDVERDLVLLGLLLFKNPLRPDTRAVVEKLREGEVRCVMVTGDAAGTAICIAKEAGLVSPGAPVLLGDLAPDLEADGIRWHCQEEDLTALNELLLGSDWLTWRRRYKQWREGGGAGARGEAADAAVGRTRRARAWEAPSGAGLRSRGGGSWDDGDARSPEGAAGAFSSEEGDQQEYSFSTEEVVLSRLFEWCELAVTEWALEHLLATPCPPELRRVLLGSRTATLKKGKALCSSFGESSLGSELLTSIRIFARMTPRGKVNVVEGLMSQGLICAMVGDGGNDSGALRAAHVGLALSSATSATVVAPFTTNRASVAPIVDLLREGRAALATSFAGYKYCIHYGLLNSFFKFKTYWHGIGQPMSARYLQDLVGFLSFSWAISLCRPADALVDERPTSSLFSPVTISSVVGIWIFNMVFMELALLLVTSHPDFVPFPVHLVRVTQWWKLSRNWETNTVFFVYTFQQFWSAVVFSFGHVFRLPWYANLYLLALFSSGFGFLVFLAVSGPNAATRAFHLVYEPVDQHEPWSRELRCPAMPLDVRLKLLGLIFANMATNAIWEQVVVNGDVGRRLRERWRQLSKHVTLRL